MTQKAARDLKPGDKAKAEDGRWLTVAAIGRGFARHEDGKAMLLVEWREDVRPQWSHVLPDTMLETQ